MEPVSLRALAALFFKVGSTTFGGGDPTMAALQRELTERKGWLTREQYGLAYSLARITPGTNVLAFCAGAAYLVRGWTGSAAAVTGASAPSALIIVWLTIAFENASRSGITRQALAAVLAAVTGMMLASAWLLLRPGCTAQAWPRVAVLAGGTFLLRLWLGWSPVPLMFLAAAVGWFWPEPERGTS